jgi:AcrR family transcriptional regulator
MTDRYHHGDLPNALRRAACDVIVELGLGGFSLREVARRAGVSHTAPAHHFGDMAGLLTSVAVEGFDHLTETTLAAVGSSEDPAERLIAMGTAYIETGIRFPAHCEVMFRHDVVRPDDPDLVRAGSTAYAVLRDVVAGFIADEDLDIDPDDGAKLCWSTMQGLLVLHSSMVGVDEAGGRTPRSREELVVFFTRAIVAGLRTLGRR